MRRLILLCALSSLVACGDDDGTPDGSADMTVADGAGDTSPADMDLVDMDGDAEPDPAACDTAVADGVCTFDGQNCGSCTDLCSPCSLLRCNAGRWRAIERPARCFSCGSLQCVTMEQYCSETVSGMPGGGSSFSCENKPESCMGPLTCECLSSVGGECDDSGDGIVVRVFAPGTGM